MYVENLTPTERSKYLEAITYSYNYNHLHKLASAVSSIKISRKSTFNSDLLKVIMSNCSTATVIQCSK